MWFVLAGVWALAPGQASVGYFARHPFHPSSRVLGRSRHQVAISHTESVRIHVPIEHYLRWVNSDEVDLSDLVQGSEGAERCPYTRPNGVVPVR